MNSKECYLSLKNDSADIFPIYEARSSLGGDLKQDIICSSTSPARYQSPAKCQDNEGQLACATASHLAKIIRRQSKNVAQVEAMENDPSPMKPQNSKEFTETDSKATTASSSSAEAIYLNDLQRKHKVLEKPEANPNHQLATSSVTTPIRKSEQQIQNDSKLTLKSLITPAASSQYSSAYKSPTGASVASAAFVTPSTGPMRSISIQTPAQPICSAVSFTANTGRRPIYLPHVTPAIAPHALLPPSVSSTPAAGAHFAAHSGGAHALVLTSPPPVSSSVIPLMSPLTPSSPPNTDALAKRAAQRQRQEDRRRIAELAKSQGKRVKELEALVASVDTPRSSLPGSLRSSPDVQIQTAVSVSSPLTPRTRDLVKQSERILLELVEEARMKKESTTPSALLSVAGVPEIKTLQLEALPTQQDAQRSDSSDSLSKREQKRFLQDQRKAQIEKERRTKYASQLTSQDPTGGEMFRSSSPSSPPSISPLPSLTSSKPLTSLQQQQKAGMQATFITEAAPVPPALIAKTLSLKDSVTSPSLTPAPTSTTIAIPAAPGLAKQTSNTIANQQAPATVKPPATKQASDKIDTSATASVQHARVKSSRINTGNQPLPKGGGNTNSTATSSVNSSPRSNVVTPRTPSSSTPSQRQPTAASNKKNMNNDASAAVPADQLTSDRTPAPTPTTASKPVLTSYTTPSSAAISPAAAGPTTSAVFPQATTRTTLPELNLQTKRTNENVVGPRKPQTPEQPAEELPEAIEDTEAEPSIVYSPAPMPVSTPVVTKLPISPIRDKASMDRTKLLLDGLYDPSLTPPGNAPRGTDSTDLDDTLTRHRAESLPHHLSPPQPPEPPRIAPPSGLEKSISSPVINTGRSDVSELDSCSVSARTGDVRPSSKSLSLLFNVDNNDENFAAKIIDSSRQAREKMATGFLFQHRLLLSY
jgi:hypothetical protein